MSTRRKFLAYFTLGIATLAFVPRLFNFKKKNMSFELPQLKYSYNELEPHIDAKTMEIHHSKHHNGYTTKLNAAIEGTELAGKSIEEILKSKNLSSAVRNNGGGFYNHCLFWEIITPNGGGIPNNEVGNAIVESFGSFDNFKDTFSKAAATQFGSGWCWLSIKSDKLVVTKTPNAENPLIHGMKPILGCDVWEHSYYLDYKNKRPAYLENFFDKLINWDFVESNL